MSKRFTEVIGGRFHCEACGRDWVGTWHGPRNEMRCAWCDKPMFEEAACLVGQAATTEANHE